MIPDRSIDLIAVLQGSLSEHDFGARHALSPREVQLAREHYLAGLADAARATKRSVRSVAALMAVAFVAVSLVSFRAWAGACSAPSGFPSALGLTHFCPDEPAMATEMNANTKRTIDLVAQKVGALGTADISTSGALTSASVTAVNVNAANVTASTKVTAAALDIGAYSKSCGSSPCYCNAVGEHVLTWGTTCANTGHGIYNALPANNGTLNGMVVSCYNVGNGQVGGSTAITIVCAKLTVN